MCERFVEKGEGFGSQRGRTGGYIKEGEHGVYGEEWRVGEHHVDICT